MYKKKKIIAIIPARGGSQGFPGKNIKMFNGKPMIAHSILKALEIEEIDKVLVTTDSVEIAEISKRHGADVPFLRDENLAKSDSPFTPVIVDAIERSSKIYGDFDFAVILQANSPLTRKEDIQKAIVKLISNSYDVLFTVTESDHPPQWTIKLNNEKPEFVFLNDNGQKISNRQSMELTYRSTGAIYVVNINYLMNNKETARLALPANGQNSGVLVTEPLYSIDIDTELDFLLAQTIINKELI